MMSSTPGEDSVSELLRRLGDEALVHEAESAGLAPRAGRLRCPWVGCEHKGAGRERDAVVFAAGHPRVHCYACGSSGDLVDLLVRTRGWNREEVLAHVRGQAVPTSAPQLRVVGRTPPEEDGKLAPAEAQRLWDSLAVADDIGRRYLEGRQLEGAEAAGLVRYAKDDSADKGLASYARRGYRVAALLTDVVGNARGLQLRLTREARAKETKILSVKGSVTSRAFFGRPADIEAAPVVVVAEGLADTLATSLWADGHAVVVGAAGKGFLPRLAEELEAAGVDVSGKLFALLPQNDRPQNASRREFVRLAHLLQARGGRVVMVATPAEYKDVAEYHAARPEQEWPPPELARAMGEEPGADAPPKTVTPAGCAAPLPAQVRTDRYAQDFTTLCALLDDASSREVVLGPGELSWCEMTQQVRVGGRAVSETDLSTARFGLEGQGTDGKRLKWGEDDVAKALRMLARRASTHPVRDWLRTLRWDSVCRLDAGLPGALGHGAGSFEALLLRRWLVSAVARALSPGCKVDTVLVLVGAQGIGKSTFFSLLGGEWHTDSRVDVGDRDSLLVMRRAWLVEWAELDSMRRSRDQEALKSFLTSRVDTFRAPYARDVVQIPRHCVFVGSTNDREFLSDSSGNRRFWPVCVDAIDLDWVRRHREQLFAEARVRYEARESWWLTADEEAQLAARNREHELHDAWIDPVSDWLADNLQCARVTTAQVLHTALAKEKIGDWTRADEMRVAAVLRQLGWLGPRRERTDAGVRRVFVRPEDP